MCRFHLCTVHNIWIKMPRCSATMGKFRDGMQLFSTKVVNAFPTISPEITLRAHNNKQDFAVAVYRIQSTDGTHQTDGKEVHRG